MADYQALVTRAVAGNYNDESRRLIYDRMRRLQLAQLDKVEPPLNDAETKRERLALEQAIRTVERGMRATDSSASDPESFAGSPKRGSVRRLQRVSVLGLIVIQALVIAWFLLVPIPSTRDLDADLDRIREEIKQTSTESEKYGPSILKSLIELRKQTLQSTETMLLQKKASMVRRINLDFVIDGSQLRPASDEELSRIQEEIGKAEQKLSQSEKNASKYTGGIVQAMTMMTVETDQLAISQLRLKYYSAKYGLPFFFPQADAAIKQQTPPAGNVVKDGDAL